MRVQEIMTEEIATCTPETSLQEVAEMMVDCDCGAIPVVDASDPSKPAGIVTDRDIVTRAVARGRNPLEMRAADVMTRKTVTVSADADVEEAERLMKECQIRRLIVSRNGSGVVGMLAQADLARRISEQRTGDVVEDISRPTAGAHG